MAEAVEQYLTDEEIIGRIEDAGEKARVSPFDPDFLCFALPFAIVFDALDIILELTSFIAVPKLIGIAFDVFVFFVLCYPGWIYWRTGKIVKSREEQKQALQKKMAEKSTKLQQQLARRVTKSALRRTLVRGSIVLLGELIPFVGLIPFWTIAVISTLKEK